MTSYVILSIYDATKSLKEIITSYLLTFSFYQKMSSFNIFQYSKTFFLQQIHLLKRKFRHWLAPNGTRMRRIRTFLGGALGVIICPPLIYVKLDFIYFQLTATNGMSEKNQWTEILGPKVDKVCFFSIFFNYKYSFRKSLYRRVTPPLTAKAHHFQTAKAKHSF